MMVFSVILMGLITLMLGLQVLREQEKKDSPGGMYGFLTGVGGVLCVLIGGGMILFSLAMWAKTIQP